MLGVIIMKKYLFMFTLVMVVSTFGTFSYAEMPSFALSSNTALPVKTETLSKSNPLVLANNATIIRISDVDFHDKKTRANFRLKLIDDYGDDIVYRVSKIKGKAEVKIIESSEGLTWWGGGTTYNEIAPCPQELSDLLDYFVWNMHN
jgi:hypothetical protein